VARPNAAAALADVVEQVVRGTSRSRMEQVAHP
jgi:hypothetical protein